MVEDLPFVVGGGGFSRTRGSHKGFTWACWVEGVQDS